MNQPFPAQYFTSKVLVSLMGIHQRLQSLVWVGGERKLTPYPIKADGQSIAV